MSEPVERFQRAQALFAARMEAIQPGSWDTRTALPGCSVRDLVGHLVDEQRWAAPLLAGRTENLDSAGLPGVFDPAVDVADDADRQTRLLARYGRRT